MAKQKFFSITYSGFYMNNSLRTTKPRIDARCPLHITARLAGKDTSKDVHRRARDLPELRQFSPGRSRSWNVISSSVLCIKIAIRIAKMENCVCQ